MTSPERSDRLELTRAATKDLKDSLTWWAARDPAIADGLRETLGQMLGLLAAGQLDGPESMFSGGRLCRRFYVHPFWIYYRRRPDVLRVLRIYHHARAPL